MKKSIAYSELIKGNYYHMCDSSNSSIFQTLFIFDSYRKISSDDEVFKRIITMYSLSEKDWNNSKIPSFKKDNCWSVHNREIRECTPLERLWMDTCIKEDKYIPLSEIKQDYEIY